MFNENFSNRMASMRKKNDVPEMRHKEIELDKKYALENGSAIMPSQIKVTITGKPSCGYPHRAEFDGYSPRANQFSHQTGRGNFGSGFSKSMSRLPQDSKQCSNFNQNQQRPFTNYRNENNHRNPLPPLTNRNSTQFTNNEDLSQRLHNAPPRYVKIDAAPVHDTSNANQNRQNQSHFTHQRTDLVIKNTSGPHFNQRGYPSRNQKPSRRQYENTKNYERGNISSAKSMSSLDCSNPSREINNVGIFPTSSNSNFAPRGDARNYSSRNTSRRFYNNPRKHEVSFCNQNPENMKCNGNLSVLPDSIKMCADPKTGRNCQISEISTQTSFWPLQPVPYDSKGLWTRGMIRREKGQHVDKSNEASKESSRSDAVVDEHKKELYVAPSSYCSKATSPHRPIQNEESNLCVDFVEFDDEYIDDNPLDDLDQFTLKIDMDGGFIVHDASIRDPILQKPICSWLDEDCEDGVLDVKEKSGLELDILLAKKKKRSSSYTSHMDSIHYQPSNVQKSSSRIKPHRQSSELRRSVSEDCLVNESDNRGFIQNRFNNPSYQKSFP